MRASNNITRRVRPNHATEEKKDDHIPVTTYPGAARLRRRKKSKEHLRWKRRMQTLAEFSPAIIAFVFLLIFFAARGGISFSPFGSWSSSSPSRAVFFSVTFPNPGHGKLHLPGPNLMHEDSSEEGPDYGHLDHHSDFEELMEGREILWEPSDHIWEHFEPDPQDDWFAGREGHYYMFDDDEKRNPYHRWDDDHIHFDKHCRRTAYHRDMYLNCNNFHQLDLPRMTLSDGVNFIGAGSYRDVFLVNHQTAVDLDMVLKVAEISNDYDHEIYECMRMEGAVTAHLSPHPLLVDIYGFCALSMFSEAMMKGDVEHFAVPKYHREKCHETPKLTGDELLPQNDLTPTKKVEWALNMVEAMALLHNHDNGLIIHDDVQLVQYMVKSDGNLKLGDFNRAEFPLYDEENGEYCKYLNGHGHGDWRSPEEYRDDPLDEKIDIWSLGANMYALLTGVYPYYHECKEDNVKEFVKDGKIPYLDPKWGENSYAEGELAKIVKSCFAFEASDRPSIADLILRLREVVEENKRLEEKPQ